MNISEKYKTIWIAPERTGSRKVAEILAFYEFKNDGKRVFDHVNKYAHSHTSYVDEHYNEYSLIVNLRNPYSRVVSIFKNFYDAGKIKTPDVFKKYLREDLSKGNTLQVVLNPTLRKKPDFIIRLEHMEEDILKIPFICDVLSAKQLNLMTQHGKGIDEWESFYDQESKDIVYSYCRDQFIYGGYSK